METAEEIQKEKNSELVRGYVKTLGLLHENGVLKDNEYFPPLRRLQKLIPDFSLEDDE